MQINEKTGLYDNYGVWHVPFWQTASFLFWVKIAIITLIVSIVVLCVLLYMRYRKNRLRTPWEMALKGVEQLKSEHMVYAEKGKEFYLAISSILKNYLSERFGYDLLGKTDKEIIVFLEDHFSEKQIVAEIKELLSGSVIIKFANAQAAQERIDKDYNRIISIIQLTIPEKK